VSKEGKIGIVIIVFCILLILFIIPDSIPTIKTSGMIDSPRLFPYICSLLLMITGIYMIIYYEILSKHKANKETIKQNKNELLRIIFFIIISIIYFIMINKLGYFLSTLIVLPIIFWYFGFKNKKIIITISIIFVLAIYLLFYKIMLVPFPQGSIFS